MTVKQISVFLENKPGQMAELADLLSKNNINMQGLSLAEASDFGIARIIVDDVIDTMKVLRDADYICSATDVVVVALEDRSGSLSDVIHFLGANDINIEYMYAVPTGKAGAYMVLRVPDADKAVYVLKKNNIKLISRDNW